MRAANIPSIGSAVKRLAKEKKCDHDFLASMMLHMQFLPRNTATLRDLKVRCGQWISLNRKAWLTDPCFMLNEINAVVAICATKTLAEEAVYGEWQGNNLGWSNFWARSAFEGMHEANAFAKEGLVPGGGTIPIA